ncbi:MAG: hypothetical protein HYY06_25830 [Deltaproteobacteria bacterium]|nr:hypothetical protein [Deltaproteobacteria bacterium]
MRDKITIACLLIITGAPGLDGCGGEQQARRQRARRGERAQGLRGSHAEQDQGRCDRQGREVQDQDTDEDGVPDIRKVYVRVGEGEESHLVMVCREIDLNRDGVKDVFRYYTDEGRPLREESDRDFDGRIDSVNFFESGAVARRETDTNRDGRVDTWVYLDRGTVSRAERDSNADGRKDVWEYYENGHVIRVGKDVDGDGRVDHWDRNEAAIQQEESAGTGVTRDEADGGTAEDEEPAPPTKAPAKTKAPSKRGN